jgi:hypothetical protein
MLACAMAVSATRRGGAGQLRLLLVASPAASWMPARRCGLAVVKLGIPLGLAACGRGEAYMARIPFFNGDTKLSSLRC